MGSLACHRNSELPYIFLLRLPCIYLKDVSQADRTQVGNSYDYDRILRHEYALTNRHASNQCRKVILVTYNASRLCVCLCALRVIALSIMSYVNSQNHLDAHKQNVDTGSPTPTRSIRDKWMRQIAHGLMFGGSAALKLIINKGVIGESHGYAHFILSLLLSVSTFEIEGNNNNRPERRVWFTTDRDLHQLRGTNKAWKIGLSEVMNTKKLSSEALDGELKRKI